ncbi:MAG: urease accessory protein UreF [Phenylobacterium sp.]
MRTDAAQLRLLAWFSPAFPIGAFGWSHGLETAIRAGWVASAGTLQAWIEGLLHHGSGWTDAVLFKLAFETDLADLAELARALAPSRERLLETTQLGAAFAEAVRPWLAGEPFAGPYPVAAGAACARAGMSPAAAMPAFLQGFAANLVSVAVRAMPMGQREAVGVIARLEPCVLEAARRAASAGPDDLGACAFRSDIAAMRHETLQPRLFLS